MNTDQTVAAEEVHAFADGLDEFQSESEVSSELLQARTMRLRPLERATGHTPPLPNVRSNWQYNRALETAAVAILVALVVGAVLVRTFSQKERTVSAPSAEVLTVQAPSKTESSPGLAVRAAALPPRKAAVGMVRHAPGTATPQVPVSTATTVRPTRSGVSRPTRRQPMLARDADPQSTRGAPLPSSRVSRLAPQPLAAAPATVVIAPDRPGDNQRAAPAMTAGEPAAPEIGAQVSVTTSNSDSDELTFRWSAPVGTFADPSARQTRFFCPETPQPVTVTVIVKDEKGAAATDTISVQCVAPTR